MRKVLATILGVWFLAAVGHAQFGSFSDAPIEIRATGETKFVGGVAIAEDNVQIHYQGTDIYCDYAEYNPETREVLLVGNIRIYKDGQVLNGHRAIYNLENRRISALEFDGGTQEMKFSTLSLRSSTMKEFRPRALTLTTSDSSEPDYHVRAKAARIYPDDRVIFSNATLYLGQLPVFWFPYLYAPIGQTGWELKPGMRSTWGAFLLTGYRFPLTSKTDALARFDYRSERGVGIGIDLDSKYGPKDLSTAKFRAYYTYDNNPGTNDTAFKRPKNLSKDRWLVSFQNRLVVNDDIYATANINSISDDNFLQDFYPGDFLENPQPDNNVALNWLTETSQYNLTTRWQMNDWQEITGRLPEFTWTAKQAPLFGLPVFYDGSTRVGYLTRQYPTGAQPQYITELQEAVYNPNLFLNTEDLHGYDSARFDTYHQLSYPNTYFGWLSLIPKVGIRGTYYSRTGDSREGTLNYVGITEDYGSGTFRPVVNAGIEGSFKLKAKYEQAQSSWLGLDGLMHVIQPYFNYAWVQNMGDSANDILQFDRVIPSSNPLPLNFPQFTAIDSIDTSNILRLGVRNRLLTRRDNDTFEWFSWDTFFDLNFENPYIDDDLGTISNLVNAVAFAPVPWFRIETTAQIPITDQGFTDVNTTVRWQPARDFSFWVSQRYIESNPYFQNDSMATGGAFWRINDNWGVSASSRYDFTYDTWDVQRYMVHRDLSSWMVSAGLLVTDNRATFNNKTSGEVGVGFLLMFTLKDAPQVSLPLAFDVLDDPGGGN